MKYSKKSDELIKKLSISKSKECKNIIEDITELSDLYQKRDDRVDKIVKVSDKQQMAILKLNEELDDYKHNLEIKVEEEIQKRKDQEELLIEQSRLASIAEMIDAVAHQWVQPINILSMQIDLLKMDANKDDGVSAETINEFRKSSFAQIEHLMETLNNFRQFFRPIKDIETFSVKEALNSVLSLVKDELLKYTIEIEFFMDDDFYITGNSNEFKHILLNLISNSKYAFLDNDIKNRKIIIKISEKDKSIDFIDNAGGIDEKIIDKIFDMHVTNKGKKGTGIGLYMSAQIAKKHNGELLATNVKNGAKFTFKLKD